MDVILGVNGYVWIAKHVEPIKDTPAATGGGGSEQVSGGPGQQGSLLEPEYDEDIAPETRREIARLAGCIRQLVQKGRKVDEDMVVRAYEESLEEMLLEEGEEVDLGYH